jgi:hypothetical protein
MPVVRTVAGTGVEHSRTGPDLLSRLFRLFLSAQHIPCDDDPVRGRR